MRKRSTIYTIRILVRVMTLLLVLRVGEDRKHVWECGLGEPRNIQAEEAIGRDDPKYVS